MNDIHGLKQAQEALRASEGELRLIMDNVPARVAYIDREFRYRFVNGRNEAWLGESRKDLNGRRVEDVIGADALRAARAAAWRACSRARRSRPRCCCRSTGPREPRWESIHYAPNRDSDGNVVGIYAVHGDIHDEKRNEEALRRVNWELSSHIGNTPLAVLEWDRDLQPRALVRAGGATSSASNPPRCSGMSLTDNPMLHDDEAGAMVDVVGKLMTGLEPRATGLTRNHRKDGETIWCEWYHSALLGDDGQIVSILSFVQDVSARIRAEERLQHMATRDALTGLPNRLLLHERLSQAIAQARRGGRRVGVLFIDLDRFKNVNDTLGHRIGDELLKHVTRALSGDAARDRPARAPRRRRVHGDRRGLRRPAGARAHRAEAARRDRAAVPDRGPRHLRDVVDRHRGLPGRLRRSRGAAQARRRRDVPVEGARPQHLPVPRHQPGRAPPEAAHARDGAARRAQGRQARAALPAGRATSPTARSSAPRRCCAGATRSTATCRRRCSCRSPRRRG